MPQRRAAGGTNSGERSFLFLLRQHPRAGKHSPRWIGRYRPRFIPRLARALSGPALAFKKSCHPLRADHSVVLALPRSSSNMRTLAIVLGLAFAVIAIVYWLVPAGSLPSVAVQKSASLLAASPKCGLLNQSHTRSLSC